MDFETEARTLLDVCESEASMEKLRFDKNKREHLEVPDMSGLENRTVQETKGEGEGEGLSNNKSQSQSCGRKIIQGREKIHPNNGSGITGTLTNINLSTSSHISRSIQFSTKIWRSLIHPLEWRVNKEGVPYKYPWLLFPQGGEKGTRYNLYDPLTTLTHSISIPESEECEVWFSNKGWLLLTKHPTSIFFFFEPFTRTRIQVPDLWQMEAVDGFCFSGTPTSPNWKIFGIRHLQQRVINVWYLGQGDSNWIKITVHSATFPLPSFTNPVSDGNSLYYLRENGSVICFKLFTDDEGDTHIGWHIECSASRYFGKSRQRFLIWYEEELISVFVDQGRGTHVVKLDKGLDNGFHSTDWRKRLLQGKEQNIKNTVQMSMFLDNEDNRNISYMLEREKNQVYKREEGGYSQISHLYHAREFLSATWIRPLLLPHIFPTF
ncbi:hypothetical protein CXB51_011231 [Gossypium anomalum]|uniref:KIB1-4 beta-propeller domain-containing protein n=1 Tax=Gossypium anomalum TaxID=47600 RepID=A0A8J6D3L1_9ROSI|nr:hypothetical protein CXB51_011231 [Gossypium anomalum]